MKRHLTRNFFNVIVSLVACLTIALGGWKVRAANKNVWIVDPNTQSAPQNMTVCRGSMITFQAQSSLADGLGWTWTTAILNNTATAPPRSWAQNIFLIAGGPMAVTATYGTETSYEVNVYVVGVDLGSVTTAPAVQGPSGRIPIYGTIEGVIPVTITGLPAGDSITLTVSTTSGTGSATFANGTSTMTLSASASVKLHGTANSSVKDNIQVRASYNATRESCLLASKTFSVRTWPTNFRQTSVEQLTGGVLRFHYTWDSESGNTSDIDGNNIWLGEHVTYSDAGFHINPPWKAGNQDPTIAPARTSFLGTSPSSTDLHTPPGDVLPAPGPAASYTATQNYGFRDMIFRPGAVDDTLGWQDNLLGPITITRWVEFISPTGVWQYRIEKSGTSNTASPL